ncbi:MAG: hypothetical protein RL213_2108, partial [Bacteroidota bacterium]
MSRNRLSLAFFRVIFLWLISFSLQAAVTGNSGAAASGLSANSCPEIVLSSDTLHACFGIQASVNAQVNGTFDSLSWSGGSGLFSPDRNSSTFDYFPDSSETGTVVALVLTVTPSNPGCGLVSDTVYVIVDVPNSPFITGDSSFCASGVLSLNGSFASGTAPAIWSTFGDGSFSSTTSLVTTYSPGPNDALNGSVMFSLTSDPPSTCPLSVAVFTSNVILPSVEAGSYQVICSEPTAALEAVCPECVSFSWRTFGDGSFDDEFSSSTKYMQGPNDLMSGRVTVVVNVTDSNSCAASDTVRLFFSQPSLAIGFDSASCSTCPDGRVFVQSTGGGFRPYSYSPSSGYSGATPGLYCITVTDSVGCQETGCVQVVSAKNSCTLAATAAVSSPIVCHGGQGYVSVSASGGQLPYTGTGLRPAVAGTNTYTVADAAGCSATVSITLSEPDPLIVSAGPDFTTCGTLSPISLTGAVSVPGGQVQWSFSGGAGFLLSSATDLSIDYSPDPVDPYLGGVQFVMNYTAPSGCSATDTAVVTVAEDILASAFGSLT